MLLKLIIHILLQILLMAARVLPNSEQHVLRLEGRNVTHGVELAHIPQWVVTSVPLALDLLFLRYLGHVWRASSSV